MFLRRYFEKLIQIFGFLSLNISFAFGLSLLSGAFLFLTQTGFAFALQLFLVSIDIAKQKSIHVPKWMGEFNHHETVYFLLLLTVLYGGFRGLGLFLRGYTYDQFRYLQRNRLTHWVYSQHLVSSSRLVTLFNERVERSAQAVASLQQSLSNMVLVLGLLAALFYVAPRLAAITCAVCLIFGVGIMPLYRRIQTESKGVLKETAAINSRLIRGIKNILLLRIYSMTKVEERLSRQSLERNRNHAMRINTSSSLSVSLIESLGIVIVVASTLMGKSSLALSGGVLVTFLFLFIRLIQSTTPLIHGLSMACFHFPHLIELENWWAELGSTNLKSKMEVSPTQKLEIDKPFGWEVRNVSFGFDHPLYQDFNMKIPPKSLCLIRGSSGSGKSTLLSLLLGQQEASSGEILIQTQDGKSFKASNVVSSVSSKLGYVGTDPFVVEGSLRENLIYGLGRQPSQAEIEDCLKLVEADFVWKFPDKLEHQIQEQGIGISTGQLLRIGLCRALLRKPVALVLDEPTANLDEETEEKIVQLLESLKKELTIVVSSHRKILTTIADQIIQL